LGRTRDFVIAGQSIEHLGKRLPIVINPADRSLATPATVGIAQFVTAGSGQLQESCDNLRMVGSDIVRAPNVFDNIEQQRLRLWASRKMRMAAKRRQRYEQFPGPDADRLQLVPLVVVECLVRRRRAVTAE
jgi:hypothetical protein